MTHSTYEIVNKIIGSTEPYGDTNIDNERTKNLDEKIELVQLLVDDLIETAKFKNRPEGSMSKMGKTAQEFLDEIRDYIGCHTEEG